MKYNITSILCCILMTLELESSQAQHSAQNEKTYEFRNGQWFDGTRFVSKTVFVRNGFFINEKPTAIDSVVDLRMKFIIPPYSEAHTHRLEGVGEPPEQLIKSYLKDGVFYARNPNNIPYFTKSLFGKINIPSSLDASFANGGLTSSEGHPMILFEDQIRPHIEAMVGKTERGWFQGKAYFTIDNGKELDRKWDSIIAGRPDFIKTYLINSEDYGKASPATHVKLRNGLNPSLLPVIIAKAHSKGFKVMVHVETANDFRLAIAAGADELAHMPGFYLFDNADANRYLLTDGDAKLAASKNVAITTTLMTKSLVEDKSLLPAVEKNQQANLQMLKKYNARILIGSDHGNSPIEEIAAIRELNVFSNLELLKLWCENSAQAIFPNRKLGLLKPGYEASFLVLEGDPIKDWSNTGKIISMFKQGVFLK